MFSFALDQHGRNTNVKDAVRDTSYFCPTCRGEVYFVRDSQYKQDHFRHKSDTFCGHSDNAGESDEHKQSKESIYSYVADLLGPESVSLEERLSDGQRPDVFFETPAGDQVAVEIQHSYIGDKDWDDRVCSYTDKSISSVWLLDDMKRYINALEVHRRGDTEVTTELRVPPWMGRIARKHDGTMLDLSRTGIGEEFLIGAKLRLKPKLVRDKETGNFVYKDQPESWYYDLISGQKKRLESDSRHPQMLWMPRQGKIYDFFSEKIRSSMTRRENVLDSNYICRRSEDKGANAQSPWATVAYLPVDELPEQIRSGKSQSQWSRVASLPDDRLIKWISLGSNTEILITRYGQPPSVTDMQMIERQLGVSGLSWTGVTEYDTELGKVIGIRSTMIS